MFPMLALYVAVGQVGQAISLGQLVRIGAMATAFFASLEAMLGSVMRAVQLGALVDRLNDVVRTPSQPERTVRANRPAGPIGVSLDGVEVKAPDGSRLLGDVCLTVAPGESVAIVGPSGAGKTSLLRALAGLLDSDTGRTTFYSEESPRLSPTAVQGSLGVVTQEPWVFRGTTRDNLTLFDDEISMEALSTAMAISGFDEVLRILPFGLDTVIGDAGRALSGGERQRLALARSLARSPGILLLDEATRSLPSAAASDTIRRILSRRTATVILTTHDMSVAKLCDTVVHLAPGGSIHRVERLTNHGSDRTGRPLRGNRIRRSRGVRKNS